MVTTIAVRLIEVMFVVGALGSGLVVLLTAIEDFRTLFSKEKEK